MMRTIYSLDENRLFSGGVKEIGPKEGVPRGWIVADAPPPEGAAQWAGRAWRVLSAAELDRFGPYQDLASARGAMLGFINALTAQITAQYPAAEVSAWPAKAEAARAVVAMTARQDQRNMIQAEADLLGESLGDQAAAIVAKAQTFEAIVAQVSGLRQAVDAALVAAETSADRAAVLASAQAQAADLAAAFGLAV